ncbi:MAG: exodeoxyribonuclease VII small subunit [Acidimicrobiales bacterium]
MSADTGPEPEPAYGDALTELEAILSELEDDRVDVDVLGQRVQRAAVLIESCRRRIEAARIEVDRIVATLDTPPDV